MTIPDCPHADDAAGYVLRALSDSDAEAYRYHLGDCECCAAKVDELEFVAHALLSGVPQLTAPPDIRDRVMRVVRSEAELLGDAGAPRSPARRVRRFAPRPLAAVAIACALLALGLGTGALLNGGGQARTRTIGGTVDRVQAPVATAEMRMVAGSGAKLVVSGMPAPRRGRIYQVWLDRRADKKPPLPTDAFFSVNHRGSASVDVPGQLGDVSAVLVTSEPMGGSETPSGPPVITVRTS
jgi:hypothetical protein